MKKRIDISDFSKIEKEQAISDEPVGNFEIDLIPERREREGRSIRALFESGKEVVNISELENPLDFIKELIPKWTERAKKISQPGWYIKHASTVFEYNESWYRIRPSDIDCTDEVFEKVSDAIARSLIARGINNIHYTGMLD